MTTAPSGRFAPTPSGGLHFGSLVTAVGSYLDARHAGADWIVRIDDLDAARVRPGASDAILRTLEGFGLEWTGQVVFQSRRGALYDEALATLLASPRCYRCVCSRKDVGQAGRVGPDGPIYPGTCRSARHPDTARCAYRIDTSDVAVRLTDRVLGEIDRRLEPYVGDFIVRRSDRVHAYHLASVVDDQQLGITDVLRGADLMPSTLRQIFLCSVLGIAPPRFAHLPTVVDATGRKLSKSSNDLGVDAVGRSDALHDALAVLGQAPPASLRGAPVRVLRDWGLAHWDISSVPKESVPAAPRYLRGG